MRRLVLMVLVAAMLAAAFMIWQEHRVHTQPRVHDEEVGEAALGADLSAEPGLATRTATPTEADAPEERDPAARPDDWVIEISEILRPDGTPALGADVTIELPLPEAMTKDTHGVRISFDTWSLTWEGQPVSLRARRYLAEEVVPSEREEMPVYEAGENAVLWIYAEGCAPWFAPPLQCPADKRTLITVRLQPTRTLSGRVLTQGGRARPESLEAVHLTLPGVPPRIYSLEATVDGDGRFEFESDDIPDGPVRVTAFSSSPARDGWEASTLAERGQDDVTLVLGATYEFSFDLQFVEETGANQLGTRPVRIAAVGDTQAEEPEVIYVYALDAAPSGLWGDSGYDPHRVVLPAGVSEWWRVSLPGYESARVELSASGTKRRISLPIPMKPESDSGLLALQVVIPTGLRGTALHGELESTMGEAVPQSWWGLPETRNRSRVPAVIRLPSGQPLVLRLRLVQSNTKPKERDRGPWVVAPVGARLRAGERRELTVNVVRAGTLCVTRRRIGGLMPTLRVWAVDGATRVLLHGWRAARDDGGTKVYRASRSLPPGRWTVELIRDGIELSWSETVEVRPGKTHWLHLPDVDCLK